MSRLEIWRITSEGPRRLLAGKVDFEEHLEDWIEQDPSLIESGLTIVGRQVQTEAGPLDLLALDPQGTWVVIELKKGRLYREALAQALDYAACIAQMPTESLRDAVFGYLSGKAKSEVLDLSKDDEDGREVRVCLVGLGQDLGLERVATFLSRRYGVPIKVVTFEAYALEEQEQILVREFSEEQAVSQKVYSLPAVLLEADRQGVGAPFRAIIEAAQRSGLYVRPWRYCAMITPPDRRTTTLLTLWVQPDRAGRLKMWFGPDVIARFFPKLSQEEIVQVLGPSGWRWLTPQEAFDFAQALLSMLGQFNRGEDEATGSCRMDADPGG